MQFQYYYFVVMKVEVLYWSSGLRGYGLESCEGRDLLDWLLPRIVGIYI
jgi:hypothetical protein